MNNEKYGVIHKEHYRVYLYKLDIDEYGEPIRLCCNIEPYLLYHIFLFDEVVLQTSAILKRTDLYRFFLCHEDLFKTIYDGHHIVSPYLGNENTFSSQYFGNYLSRRKETVKEKSSINSELNAYESNGAEHVAKRLDNSFIVSDMPVADKDTDHIFRQTVINAGEEQLWKIDPSNRTYRLFSDYAQGTDIFQTFFLLQRVAKTQKLNERGMNKLGAWLRENYYIANTLATLSIPLDDFHVDFAYVVMFIKLIGLDRLINAYGTDPETIIQIKSLDCYTYLQSVYFNSSSKAIVFLYRSYYENKFTRLHRPFYERREFHPLCKLYNINPDCFAYAVNSLHKELDEILKRRREK